MHTKSMLAPSKDYLMETGEKLDFEKMVQDDLHEAVRGIEDDLQYSKVREAKNAYKNALTEEAAKGYKTKTYNTQKLVDLKKEETAAEDAYEKWIKENYSEEE